MKLYQKILMSLLTGIGFIVLELTFQSITGLFGKTYVGTTHYIRFAIELSIMMFIVLLLKK
ncbi:hypothetical protein [Fictibacillus macauensis]|nr:hypothetical protein [Fictibacillus macauensis]